MFISRSLLSSVAFVSCSVGVHAAAVAADPPAKDAKSADALPCTPTNYLTDLKAQTVGGMPSLTTNWLHLYSQPNFLTAAQIKAQSQTDSSSVNTKSDDGTSDATQGARFHIQSLLGSSQIETTGKDDRQVGVEENAPAMFAVSFGTNTFTKTSADTNREQLLFRNAAAYDLSFSLLGARGKVAATQGLCADPTRNERINSADRYYPGWTAAMLGDKVVWAPFISNGLAARSVTATGAGANSSTVGTLFLGLGIDGPMYGFGQSKDGGFMSFEVYATMNWTSATRLGSIFGGVTAPNRYMTWGAHYQLFFNGLIGIDLDYTRATNYEGPFARQDLGDMALVSLAIKPSALAGSTAKASP